MRSRGLEVSFAWLFALLAGAVILSLALYATISFVQQGRTEVDSETAAAFVALLSPIETSLQYSRASYITLSENTNIDNLCNSQGLFGRQQIQTEVDSTFSEPSAGVPITAQNKYLFSQERLEGDTIGIIAFPIYLPYKVADAIILIDEPYCFVDAPDEIKNDLEGLGIERVSFVDALQECAEARTVCFGNSRCDVFVDVQRSSVTSSATMYSIPDVQGSQALLYAAVFSDPTIYECQVQRLIKRASEIAALYSSKATILESSACSSHLQADLATYASLAEGFERSAQLGTVYVQAVSLYEKNDALSCRLF